MYFMNGPAASAGMLSSGSMGIYEQPKPQFTFKVARVVQDQKGKFESDESFIRMSRESEVRYTGCSDRTKKERIALFQSDCRKGHTDIAFVAGGINLPLVFQPPTTDEKPDKDCDFDREQGKVHIKTQFIMNGVCVRWRGWIDLERLDGVGCLEFDEEQAAIQDNIARKELQQKNEIIKDYEDKQRSYRQQDRSMQVLDLRMANNIHAGHHSHHGAVSARYYGPTRPGHPYK